MEISDNFLARRKRLKNLIKMKRSCILHRVSKSRLVNISDFGAIFFFQMSLIFENDAMNFFLNGGIFKFLPEIFGHWKLEFLGVVFWKREKPSLDQNGHKAERKKLKISWQNCTSGQGFEEINILSFKCFFVNWD